MKRLLNSESIAVKRPSLRQLIRSTSKYLNSVGIILGISLLPTVASTPPTRAAERVNVAYEILERSISVNSLEAYAKKGTVTPDLAPYIQYIPAEQQQRLRQILLKRVDLRPVAVSQFLYTPQAEILLQRLGQVIQTESRQTGSRAIRAALISAASDPQGVTVLNVLRKFPAQGVRIDLVRGLQIADELSKAVERTNKAIAFVTQESIKEASAENAVKTYLRDLRQPGSFTWKKQTLRLNDTRRNRVFYADIYLPIPSGIQQPQKPAPVIVISHGLGSDRTTFVYLAQQLASYGFVVAVPEHPGSNAQQLQNLFEGKADEAAEPSEFINRPLDVKFLLDELERLSQSDPLYQRVNVQQVGVIGQSFGGYTALVLAGATLNFDRLQKDCAAINSSWNISLLLQCRALALVPSPSLPPNLLAAPISGAEQGASLIPGEIRELLVNSLYNLRDERVKAVIAINPINSSVLGAEGLSQIQIPVMLVSGTADTVAPALAEQIQPFTWLTTPDKYLVLMKNGTHFSTLTETKSSVPLPAPVIGPDPALAQGYLKALSVAFLEVYVANQSEYQPYLTASYVENIDREPVELTLVQSLSEDALKVAIAPSPTKEVSYPKR